MCLAPTTQNLVFLYWSGRHTACGLSAAVAAAAAATSGLADTAAILLCYDQHVATRTTPTTHTAASRVERIFLPLRGPGLIHIFSDEP